MLKGSEKAAEVQWEAAVKMTTAVCSRTGWHLHFGVQRPAAFAGLVRGGLGHPGFDRPAAVHTREPKRDRAVQLGFVQQPGDPQCCY